jgi:hypothetical protein
MKKGSPVSKKPNKIKSKAKGPSKVLKQVKQLAQGLARAMSAKPAKKAQTKPAPKAKPMVKAVKAVKGTPTAKKPPAKFDTKVKKTKVAPTVKAAPVGKSAPVKTAPTKASPSTQGKKGKGVETQPSLPLPPVAAWVKPGKGGGKGAKGAKPVVHIHNEKMCRETGCENSATTRGYCRLDYIKNWKKIKRKEMILKEGKLNQYIEELVSKYPEKYVEVIRQDLSSEVNFNKVIHDLELDESMDDLDYDSDSIDSLIGSIRKEDDGFDDTDF